MIGRITTNFFKRTSAENSPISNTNRTDMNYSKNSQVYKFIRLFKTLKLKKPKILKYRTKWFSIFFNNRKLLRFFYNIKFLRQYRLTKYFSPLSKKPLKIFFNINEYSIINVLVRCRFALTLQHSKDLIDLGYIYINGLKPTNYKHIISVGDLIQVVFSKNFLINYQILQVNLMRKKLDIRYCFERWHKNRRNFYKQHTHRFPTWLYKFMYLTLPIPLFFEVDFTSLSACLVRHAINSKELNQYFTKYISLYNIRLYNWKYTT
jgi:ribosomal protein S4